jgi:hypothetical protein
LAKTYTGGEAQGFPARFVAGALHFALRHATDMGVGAQGSMIMKRPMLLLTLLAALAPGTALAAEPASPLPAGVDRDVICQLLVADTADRAERLPEDRKTEMAHMLTSLEHSESFYIGVIVMRLTDAQITAAADIADAALIKASEDQRAAYLQYCLNDATLRSRHYAQQLTAH